MISSGGRSIGLRMRQSASGIVQQRTAHDFDREILIVSDRQKRKAPSEEPPRKTVGLFWALATDLRNSLIEMAHRELPNALKVGRKEKQGHDQEKLLRREEAVQKLLNATVERYAAAIELYDQWRAPGQAVRSAAALDKALDGLSESEQLAELRRQIEMRTVALGWTEFATKWGYYADERKHKLKDLRRILVEDILSHEVTMRWLKKLPAAAVPPQLKPRALKVLGSEDADALRIEAQDMFNIHSLLPKAQAARARREAQGISDRIRPRRGNTLHSSVTHRRSTPLWWVSRLKSAGPILVLQAQRHNAQDLVVGQGKARRGRSHRPAQQKGAVGPASWRHPLGVGCGPGVRRAGR